MKDRPRVLLVSRRTNRKNKTIDWVSEVHLSLLLRERLQPVILPVAPETTSVLPLYARSMAGLLMVEGGDIQPHYYGEKAPVHELDELDPVKDEIEFWLCRQALRRKVPILGICRGMQLLNVACGGTLHLDVEKEKGGSLKHMDLDHYDDYRHPVEILEGTPLFAWYRQKVLMVNSYHHQGVKILAKRFQPMAFGPDGLIEAYHDPSRPFLVGLQFHPERMMPESPGNLRVFKAFGQAVRRARPSAKGR
jgi:gamma-glutamyl-gamma-aminobutyrate hydrolase PuuD